MIGRAINSLPMKISLVAVFLIMSVLRASTTSEPGTAETHFTQIDGLKVHYTNYGAADATLVFVHGWSCDETVWSEQAGPLAAESVRIITIDLPGHGQSDKPEIAYTMHLYARAIDAVLRDAKVQKAVIVGHSNGTAAILQFYREFRASVSGLVIVEGGLRPLFDAATLEKFLAPMRGPDYPKVVSRFIDGMTKPISDEQLRTRIKTLMLRTPQHVAVSEFEHSADAEIWEAGTIDVPVLMILAKQPLWTAEYEQFVRGIVPNLSYQVWENVSHFVMMEKPRDFNAALMKFLRTNLILPERS